MSVTLRIASWDPTKNTEIIRELTPDEKQQHAAFAPIISEADNRLSLFRMLTKNYEEWASYFRSLISPENRDYKTDYAELNRLLLNYLTFAYAIREHFEVSYRQRHKKNPEKLKEYSDFIERFCAGSWAFAFISDFRGYVQHRGLAVNVFARNLTVHGVTVVVAANAKQLLEESRDWEKSKLSIDRGNIDLVAVVRDFHQQMIQSYGPFMAKAFFPELMPASQFYGSLVKEVKARNPTASLVFIEGEPQQVAKDGVLTLSLKMQMVPNDVFGELGIRVNSQPK